MKSALLDFGIIYVLTNETDTMSKIGRTSVGTAEGRAVDYSKVHGIQWSVFTHLPTIRVTEVETNIHARLREHQVRTETNAREIFAIPPHDAERMARSLIVPVENSKEKQRLIREHARLVRQRLNKREEPYKWRAGSDMRDLWLDTYPQRISLDALVRGVDFHGLRDIYTEMHKKWLAEHHQLLAAHHKRREEYENAKQSAEACLTWWDKLKGKKAEIAVPKPKLERPNPNKFPPVPYYAVQWHSLQMRKRKEIQTPAV